MAPVPPVASRRPHELTSHGVTRTDDYYWMRDREDPEVIAYLEAENSYAEAVLAPTKDLQETLFEQIRARVQETDAGPPTRDGSWWYYSRTIEGQQYSISCRRADPDRALDAATVAAEARSGTPAREEVLLDENLLAGGSDYLALGVFDISTDQSTLAYATDLDGSESYTLRFRELATGNDLPDIVEGVYYGSAWAADNRHFFYVRPDAAMRPYQVWCHQLGEGAEDRLVFEEEDERFFVSLSPSRTRDRITISSDSRTTSETRWVDANDPTTAARVLIGRIDGVEYEAEHDGGDSWLLRSNQDGATNFALYRLREGEAPEIVIPHRPQVKLESIDAFAGHTVVSERWETDGLQRLRVVARDGTEHTIDQPEPAYSLLRDPNAEWASATYRFGYTSLVTPRSSIEYDVGTRDRTTVWTQIVRGGYDPTNFETERLWATAGDGTRVPVSVVRPVDAGAQCPCLLYGYGAYEFTVDPSFSAVRLNLLEHGVAYAIAHVRGGGELGRSWYEQGRMEHKANTFNDFIAVATFLVESGFANGSRLAARGASAGGLLMGAVTNLRPDLWRAVVAEVPFVDVVTTMSDASIPLTVTEWEEWGNPRDDRDAYERMISYSPYDNVHEVAYPALYVTAGLNDPRVGYWEPAKWVAKLRAAGAKTVLLRTELGAGHGGSSGRYDAWRDEARVQAFVLTQLGLLTQTDRLTQVD